MENVTPPANGASLDGFYAKQMISSLKNVVKISNLTFLNCDLTAKIVKTGKPNQLWQPNLQSFFEMFFSLR